LPDAIRNANGAVNRELIDIKADFGFSGKFNKGNIVVPDGSTNFDHEGDEFHFQHSERGGGSEHNFLEIPSPTEARWIGKGTWSLGGHKDEDIVCCFMMVVQDNGEPGSSDAWCLRTCGTQRIMMAISFLIRWFLPHASLTTPTRGFSTGCDDPHRFLGTQLGEFDSNGGGNV
jgi:hypothetical protein